MYMWVIYRPQQQQVGGRAAGSAAARTWAGWTGLAGLGWAGWLAGDSFGDGPDG